MASAKHTSKRSHKNAHRRHIFISTAILGVSLIFAGLYLSYQTTILSFTQTPPETSSVPDRRALPTRILISKAKINLKIEETRIIDGVWQISPKLASHLITSARPKENGNIVIYGHNKRELFASLKKVAVGDGLTVYTADGKLHNYQVTQVLTTTPKDIQWVLPTSTETLTIYTCTGIFDSKRLIVRAVPLL